MNVEHVKTFLVVAATGNFNRAAERLFVTQSTVSARIRALEDQLDRPLFKRDHSGATLTAAGIQFQRYAVTMVRAWEQARQEIALPEALRAVFGLGAQVSLWERLILKWIPWMREQASDVALRVEVDYSESMMRQLADGLLDVAVIYLPRTMPGMVIEKLLEEKLVLVSTTPREPKAGWIEDYVFVDWGTDFRAAHSQAFPEMESPAVTVGLGALALQYILDNGGSGYLPLRVVRPLLSDGRLHQVPDAPTMNRPAHMVYAANPADPDLLALAIDGLRHIASLESEE